MLFKLHMSLKVQRGKEEKKKNKEKLKIYLKVKVQRTTSYQNTLWHCKTQVHDMFKI